jgi:hypothetical protein
LAEFVVEEIIVVTPSTIYMFRGKWTSRARNAPRTSTLAIVCNFESHENNIVKPFVHSEETTNMVKGNEFEYCNSEGQWEGPRVRD